MFVLRADSVLEYGSWSASQWNLRTSLFDLTSFLHPQRSGPFPLSSFLFLCSSILSERVQELLTREKESYISFIFSPSLAWHLIFLFTGCDCKSIKDDFKFTLDNPGHPLKGTGRLLFMYYILAPSLNLISYLICDAAFNFYFLNCRTCHNNLHLTSFFCELCHNISHLSSPNTLTDVIIQAKYLL